MSKTIPLSMPSLRGKEWEYVKDCLDTGWVSSAGKYVDRFERNIANFTGARYAVACNSGTGALQIALQLVGVKPGDEVIVPTVTFVAPVNTVRYLNAEPVFMDCDSYYNMDIEKTIEFIQKETKARNGSVYDSKTARRIAAIIPVHVYGNAVDLSRLLPFCRERKIKVVEDATESLGTFYLERPLKGRHTGTVGDLGCYSFNGNKIITTGGGGMIVTNDLTYATRARYLTTQAKDDEIRYIHDEVGFNFRLSNLHAAVGVAQLEHLEEMIRLKTHNYTTYKESLKQIEGLKIGEVPAYARNNHWMYALQVDRKSYGRGRDELIGLFSKRGIEVRPLWYLNHLQKPYRQCRSYRIEKAYNLLECTLNLPCSVGLLRKDILKIGRLLKEWKRSS